MTTNKKPTAKKVAAKKAPAKKKPAAKKPAAKKTSAPKAAVKIKDSASPYLTDTDEFMKAWDAIEEKIEQSVPDKVEVDTTKAKNWLKSFLRRLFK
jgi:uncharacterized protein YhaN